MNINEITNSIYISDSSDNEDFTESKKIVYLEPGNSMETIIISEKEKINRRINYYYR